MTYKIFSATLVILCVVFARNVNWTVEKLEPIKSMEFRVIERDSLNDAEWIAFNPQSENFKFNHFKKTPQLIEYRIHVRLPSSLSYERGSGKSLLITQALHGVELRNDGYIKNYLPLSDLHYRTIWYRPFVLNLNDVRSYISDDHILSIYSSTWDSNFFISPIYIGNEAEVFWVAEFINLFSNILPWAAMVVAFICSIFFLAMFKISSNNVVYRLTAISSFCWFLVCLINGRPVYHVEWMNLIKAAVYFFIAVSIWSAANLSMAYVGANVNFYVNRFIFLYCIIGPCCFFFDLVSVDDIGKIWLPGIFLLLVPFYVSLFKCSIKTHGRKVNLAVPMLIIVGLFLAAKDLYLLTGFVDGDPVKNGVNILDIMTIPMYHINMYAAVFFLYSGVVAIKEHGGVLSALDKSNREMELKLQLQEIEIKELMLKRLQQEKFLAAQDERQLISRDLHDGLGAKLTAILYQCRAGCGELKKIELDVIAALTDLRKIIDNNNSRPKKGEFFTLVFELCVQFEELLSSRGIIFSYQIPSDVEFYFLNDEDVHISLIIQEIFINFLKHSKASKIQLSIMFENFMVLEVLESGFVVQRLIAPRVWDAYSSGNGLRNIQSRAEEMGAKFSVQSSSEGRVSTLCLPLC